MRIALFGLLLSSSLIFAWDRSKAFTYLETRQQAWDDWKPAQKFGGPCFSCHTGLSHMLARQLTGQQRLHPLERELVDGVKARVLANPPKASMTDPGAEVVLNLLTLAFDRRGPEDPVGPADRLALARLWEKQILRGDARGSWTWFNHALDPVDSEPSTFYAAALVELALSAYPAESPKGVAAMRDYLQRAAVKQPLHNRLAWIAFSPRLDEKSKGGVIRDLRATQSDDGGWATAAIGPWEPHPDAPPDPGSNAYATAWAAFAAQRAGVPCSDALLTRSLEWLVRHQDPTTGVWDSVSMNKVYPSESMQSKFMTDAATGFVAGALVACGRE